MPRPSRSSHPARRAGSRGGNCRPNCVPRRQAGGARREPRRLDLNGEKTGGPGQNRTATAEGEGFTDPWAHHLPNRPTEIGRRPAPAADLATGRDGSRGPLVGSAHSADNTSHAVQADRWPARAGVVRRVSASRARADRDAWHPAIAARPQAAEPATGPSYQRQAGPMGRPYGSMLPTVGLSSSLNAVMLEHATRRRVCRLGGHPPGGSRSADRPLAGDRGLGS